MVSTQRVITLLMTVLCGRRRSRRRQFIRLITTPQDRTLSSRRGCPYREVAERFLAYRCRGRVDHAACRERVLEITNAQSITFMLSRMRRADGSIAATQCLGSVKRLVGSLKNCRDNTVWGTIRGSREIM